LSQIDHHGSHRENGRQDDRDKDQDGSSFVTTSADGGALHCSNRAVAELASVTGMLMSTAVIRSPVRRAETWTRVPESVEPSLTHVLDPSALVVNDD
jgi:hypothetical protein